nr:copper chaperone PCu(A)C [Streptomyces sp. SID8352]
MTGALALLLAGCGSDGGSPSPAELSAGSAYMPRPVSPTMAAGFLVITNKGGTGDELTSVASDAGDVSVHRTVNGVMEKADRLPVPAHGRLVLESGGSHLMFENLRRRPQEGETVAVELRFARSGPLTVELPVKPPTYRPAGQTGTSGH